MKDDKAYRYKPYMIKIIMDIVKKKSLEIIFDP